MALIKCKECGREVSTEAANCPGCGAPIKMIPAKKAEPEKVSGLGLTVGVIVIGIAVFAWFSKEGEKSSEPSKAKEKEEMSAMFGKKWDASRPEKTPIPISKLEWEEIDKIYRAGSKVTNLQKDEQWKEFKGKRVKWTGKVSSVSDGWSGLSLQVKMNKNTLTSDLIVKLRDSEKSKALKFSEGDLVTFLATLDSWGTILPISLEDGEIAE